MDSRQPPIGDGDWTATFGRRYTLTHFDDVLTINKERAVHWSTRSPIVARWREAYGWLAHATNVPTDGSLGACHIDAVPLVRGRRRQDVAACLPVVKAAIDGLVDVGVWPDDTPEFVLSLRFWPQQTGPDSGLRMVITEAV